MLVERIRGLCWACVAVLAGAVAIVAGAGPVAADVASDPIYHAPFLEYTYDDAVDASLSGVALPRGVPVVERGDSAAVKRAHEPIEVPLRFVTDLVAPRAGAGGDGAWQAIDEVQGGAVGQAHKLGCVEACGEMLSGIPQGALSANSAEALATQLGGGWRAGYVGSGQFDSLMGTGPWGAELIQGGRIPHHMVVVDGFASNGNLVIRDPWAGGSTYQMTRDGFLDAWSGIGVFGG